MKTPREFAPESEAAIAACNRIYEVTGMEDGDDYDGEAVQSVAVEAIRSRDKEWQTWVAARDAEHAAALEAERKRADEATNCLEVAHKVMLRADQRAEAAERALKAGIDACKAKLRDLSRGDMEDPAKALKYVLAALAASPGTQAVPGPSSRVTCLSCGDSQVSDRRCFNGKRHRWSAPEPAPAAEPATLLTHCRVYPQCLCGAHSNRCTGGRCWRRDGFEQPAPAPTAQAANAGVASALCRCAQLRCRGGQCARPATTGQGLCPRCREQGCVPASEVPSPCAKCGSVEWEPSVFYDGRRYCLFTCSPNPADLHEPAPAAEPAPLDCGHVHPSPWTVTDTDVWGQRYRDGNRVLVCARWPDDGKPVPAPAPTAQAPVCGTCKGTKLVQRYDLDTLSSTCPGCGTGRAPAPGGGGR